MRAGKNGLSSPEKPPLLGDKSVLGGAGPAPGSSGLATDPKTPEAELSGGEGFPDAHRSLRIGANFGIAAWFFGSVCHRQAMVDVACRMLSRLTLQPETGFVLEVLEAFASWVVDLPASERYHHRGPYGLLEHSMDVAAETLKELERRWGGGGVALAPRDRPLWSRVTFALALLHDCGKILDMEVQAPDGSASWNPLAESLAAFKSRQGLPPSRRTLYRFRVGRGQHGHKEKGELLIPVILTGTAADPLCPFLEEAWTAYKSRHLLRVRSLPIPLEYLALQVHLADVVSARRDRMGSPRIPEARPFHLRITSEEGS
jgi:hypothetical protein